MSVSVIKPDGSRQSIPDDILNAIRVQLRGSLQSADEAAAEPRPTWNAMHTDREPPTCSTR